MSVAVVIPYGGHDASRASARELVAEHYLHDFPTWELIYATAIEEPFPKAQAVNKAVTTTRADVLVLNDADSIVPADQIIRAAKLAEREPGLVFAFTRYRRLTREYTLRCRRPVHALMAPDKEVEWEMLNSGSHGCIAIQRSCWDSVGGLDERYIGYGYEDLAFDVHCDLRWPSRRVQGDLFHLWHPRADGIEFSGPSADAERHNLSLYQELLREHHDALQARAFTR